MATADDVPFGGRVRRAKSEQSLKCRQWCLSAIMTEDELVKVDLQVMASDSMVGQPYGGMKGFSLSLVYPNVADAKAVFDALAAGGRVTMPLQKTFWAEAFGMLVDRFGTPWMVSGGMASS